MSIITILRNSWSLESTATSTNAAPDALASRMLSPYHSERWKTNNLTTMQAIIDAGEPLPWDSIFLGYTNASAAATLRITSGDSSGTIFSAPSYDRTQVLRLPYFGEFTSWHGWHETEEVQTYQFIGIEITDPANPDGHFEAGIFYAGLRVTPIMEANFEEDDGYEDLSITVRMSNGESRSRRRVRKGQRGCSWDWLLHEEKEFIRDLARTYGTSTPVVLRESNPYFPQYDQSHIWYGKLGNYSVSDRKEYAMIYNGIVHRNIGKASFSLTEV